MEKGMDNPVSIALHDTRISRNHSPVHQLRVSVACLLLIEKYDC